MFFYLTVSFSSHRHRFSSYPFCSVINPCAVPTSLTLEYYCLQGFWAATHCMPVGDGGDWGVIWSTSCRETFTQLYRPGSTRSSRANGRAAWGRALSLHRWLDRNSSRSSLPKNPLAAPIPRGHQVGSARYAGPPYWVCALSLHQRGSSVGGSEFIKIHPLQQQSIPTRN